MKLRFFPSSFLFFSFACFNLFGQLPNGVWRDHLPYSGVEILAEVGDKIFCSSSGGLFSLNKNDYSLQKYSKVNGLSDVSIKVMGYSEATSTLLLGYRNSNIDLIRNDSIINIPDIKMKIIIGDKSIYNVMFINQMAYLSCGFGIVVIDLIKNEIKDTYQFGENGGQIKVNGTAFDGKYLYSATDIGIFRADINSPNLVDYNFWSKLGFLPAGENIKFRSIVYFNGKLLANLNDNAQDPAFGLDRIITISENSWAYWERYGWSYIKQLYLHNNYLHICSSWSSTIFNTSLEEVYSTATGWPSFSLYDKDKILWVADLYVGEGGLIKSENGTNSPPIAPNGPTETDIQKIKISENQVWITGASGISLFKNEKWENFNYRDIPELKGIYYYNDIAIDKDNPDHVLVGTGSDNSGFGLIDLNADKNIKIYNEENSILKTINNIKNDIRITGLTYDREGNIWLSTTLSDDPVYVIRPDGTWENISFTYNAFGTGIRIGDIYYTSYGDLWLIIERAGILSFKENSDGSISEEFFTVRNQDGDVSGKIFSVTEDLEGDVWIGTDQGPVVYYKPVIDYDNRTSITGYQVLIPRTDEEIRNGKVTADPLLQYERINCIEIDGANRKWLGTEKSGAFLMSEDGKKEIYHFDKSNSPMFTDNVVSISINKKTGEIFFGTNNGILSYKGQATEGDEEYTDVYVYPNPIREDYEGDITITGLIKDSNVKITDVSGNLVYETTSLGGQAIWDGKNFKGEKVYTGVYLVFCSNEDGTKTHVTKLLFIH